MINGDYILVVAPPDYPGVKYRGRYCYEHRLVWWKEHNFLPKDDEIKTCSGAVYKKDPDALMPAILTHYYALRKAAKVDKKIANTEYEELKVILERRKGL